MGNPEKKILGFIGTGNMGGALARAARRRTVGEDILLANRTLEKAEALAAELHCRTADNLAVAREADMLFLGVKPQGMAGLLSEISPVLKSRTDRFLLVSMAAGLTVGRIQELAGGKYPVIRIMPNTPAVIGQGMTLYCSSPEVRGPEEQKFLELMAGTGRLSRIPEDLMSAAGAVAGCGPAFADLFMEALADGGVACGLPRAQAVELAAQMLAGAGSLLLETGKHPGELKDTVCSPGGSTIQGVRKLEAAGFRSAVMEAVIAACEKSDRLG